MDLRPLLRSLQRVVGREHVLHLAEDMVVYEQDASVDAGSPLLAVLPSTTQEVSQVMALAHHHHIPVVARGAGTGLSGGAVASQGGIIMPLSRMRRILEVDPANQIAVVEPGVVNLELSQFVAPYGLYYVPDPSSERACTLGGNIAENSGGPHCLAYGVTTNHVLGLEVVLADGTVTWLGGKLRDPPGYDLVGTVVGSEGTLAIATKIVVRLARLPEAIRTFLAIYDELDAASNAVSRIIARGVIPAALEMLDNLTIQAVEPAVKAGYPLDAGAVLLVELDGMRESVEADAADVQDVLHECGAREIRSADEPEERQRLWAGRKGALGALGRLAPNYYLLDGVVPRTRLPEALRRASEICARHGLGLANVFHAGDGNLHPCILFDGRDADQRKRAMEAGGEILKMCVELGGALSGEHGIGLEKQAYMPLMFTPDDLAAMARLPEAFGSHGLLNPGKVFPSEGSPHPVSHQGPVSRVGPGAHI